MAACIAGSPGKYRLTTLLTLVQDTDLFADMGPTAVEDAWQWLPLQARLTLVHFLGHLPQLAGQLSNSNPESRAKLDDALQQLLEGAELTPAQRDALKMATELVVCGEEVSSPSTCMCSRATPSKTDFEGLWIGRLYPPSFWIVTEHALACNAEVYQEDPSACHTQLSLPCSTAA